MNQSGYKKLLVWQKADELAEMVYINTRNFPKEEMFGITSQLRRAALSIVLNIVEGSGRQHKNETKQFINIALGSIVETEYLLDFSKKLGFLEATQYYKIMSKKEDVGGLLWRMFQSLKSGSKDI